MVTGASGSLGQQLLYDFVRRGVTPVVQVRENSDASYIDELGLEKRTADLMNEAQVKRMVEGVDAVIHSAARVNFRRDGLDRFTEINTLGAARTFEAARSAGVRRFVQISSIVGVGALSRTKTGGEGKVDETFPFNLGDLRIPYIQTKREAEEKLLTLAKAGGPELVIVNLPKVVAPSRDGKDREVTERLFSRPFLPVLPNRFNLVDVRDASAGTILALEKGRANERYILGGEDVCIRDLVDLIADILGMRPWLLVPLPRFPLKAAAALSVAWKRLRGKKRISFYPDLVRMLDFDWTCSSEKAREELGYTNRRVRETVTDLLNDEFTGTYMKPAL